MGWIKNFVDKLKSAKSGQGKDRPNPEEMGSVQLWYPSAEILDVKMPTRGKYPKKYPEGAIIHFTAGWDTEESKAINEVKRGKENGYCFFVIGPTGKVYQSFPLSDWGYHAGKSHWPSLGSDVSKRLVGIEICNPGKLRPQPDGTFKSWFGQVIKEGEIRHIKGLNSKFYQEEGFYKKYTDAQEKALVDLLVWLYINNPLVFHIENILGHCDVSPGRKNDPGGALSMPIESFQGFIKEKVLEKLTSLN